MTALLWTINNFPTYAVLSGWNAQDFLACPCCMDATCYERLKCSHKQVYMGHHRYLEWGHRFRRDRFDGTIEMRDAPKLLTGFEIYDQVRDITNVFGKSILEGERKMQTGQIGRNEVYFLTCRIGKTCYCVIAWM